MDKHCSREQIQKLLSLGIGRKYPHNAFLAESRNFYFWELMEYIPDEARITDSRWFFEIRRDGGMWDIGYVLVNMGGEPIREVTYSNENPAIAAADLLIYLKENNYV